MKKFLKPSIAMDVKRTSHDNFVTFLYDGGRKKLTLNVDLENLKMIERLRNEGVEHSEDLRLFLDRKMLCAEDIYLAANNENWLSRQNLFLSDTSNYNPSQIEEILSNTRILIVGLGGIGSNVLNALLRMGFRKFLLIDPDKVASSNLNRQSLYDFSNVGEYKVTICQNHILKFPNASCISAIYKPTEEIAQNSVACDISIICADQPSIFYVAQQTDNFTKGDPDLCIGGGYYSESSFFGPIIKSYDKNIIQKLESNKIDDISGHMKGVGGNTFATANIVASMLSQSILMWFLNRDKCVIKSKIGIFDWRTYQTNFVNLQSL